MTDWASRKRPVGLFGWEISRFRRCTADIGDQPADKRILNIKRRTDATTLCRVGLFELNQQSLEPQETSLKSRIRSCGRSKGKPSYTCVYNRTSLLWVGIQGADLHLSNSEQVENSLKTMLGERNKSRIASTLQMYNPAVSRRKREHEAQSTVDKCSLQVYWGCWSLCVVWTMQHYHPASSQKLAKKNYKWTSGVRTPWEPRRKTRETYHLIRTISSGVIQCKYFHLWFGLYLTPSVSPS